MLRRAAIIAAMALCLCHAAMSAASEPVPDRAAALAQEGWILTFSADLSLAPAYPGARTRSLQPSPGFSFRRAGEAEEFGAPDDGIDVSLFDAGWLKAGPVAKLASARDQSGNAELRGLRFVDWTLEAGAFAELWPMEKLRTRAEIRQGVNGHGALVASLGAEWVEKAGGLTFSAGPRATVGGGRYTRTFFSVTPAEAAANGRVAAYRADGGLTSLGAIAAATYTISDKWSGTLYAGYDRLAGVAARSPVTSQLGSRNQFAAGAILSRSFLYKGQ